jgi:hypothetical protein
MFCHLQALGFPFLLPILSAMMFCASVMFIMISILFFWMHTTSLEPIALYSKAYLWILWWVLLQAWSYHVSMSWFLFSTCVFLLQLIIQFLLILNAALCHGDIWLCRLYGNATLICFVNMMIWMLLLCSMQKWPFHWYCTPLSVTPKDLK